MRYNMDARKETFYQKHRITESWKVSAAQNPTFTKSPNTSVKRKLVTKLLLTSQRHHNHLMMISADVDFTNSFQGSVDKPKKPSREDSRLPKLFDRFQQCIGKENSIRRLHNKSHWILQTYQKGVWPLFMAQEK